MRFLILSKARFLSGDILIDTLCVRPNEMRKLAMPESLNTRQPRSDQWLAEVPADVSCNGGAWSGENESPCIIDKAETTDEHRMSEGHLTRSGRAYRIRSAFQGCRGCALGFAKRVDHHPNFGFCDPYSQQTLLSCCPFISTLYLLYIYTPRFVPKLESARTLNRLYWFND